MEDLGRIKFYYVCFLNLFVWQVDCFEGLDYNGIYPWSKFVSSPKLTAVFQEHLKNVILTFQYRNGHVDDIMVPEHVSEFALNICKGILNLYENTIKKDQKTYNLKEVIPVLFVIWHCDLLLSLLSNNTVGVVSNMTGAREEFWRWEWYLTSMILSATNFRFTVFG